VPGTLAPHPALDRVLTAARPRHRGPEAAALAGVDPLWAARIWRAAGFDGAFEGRELSDDDVRILAGAAEVVRSGQFDEAQLFGLARLFNLAAAPLAEAAAAAIRRQPTDGEETLEQLDSSLALFEDVVLHAWRRRLLRVLASGRHAERGEEGVAFVDLVGFTGLVQRDDDEWLGVLDRLEAVAFDVVAAHGGRVIKTIGDEVMFVHPDRAGTVATCADLVATAAGQLPKLRVGAAWGTTVATRGDRFGTPVNLASRLSRRCRPGEILLCPRLSEHAPGVHRGRPRHLKGLGWVRPGRLVPGATG